MAKWYGVIFHVLEDKKTEVIKTNEFETDIEAKEWLNIQTKEAIKIHDYYPVIFERRS
jgi:hypothetical protein